ncbi:aminopeptidase N [Sulfurimonas sp. HSL-1716]|uniref:aminopeptidase N n=1 Tax=Hydrocurvibacter sulfurireducens TaxID=3131937 RepID=UPI0031FA16CB
MSKHKMIFLKDYRAPDFTIEKCYLEFDIFEEYTIVKNRMNVVQCCNDIYDVRFNGVDLELLSFKVDGKILSRDMYKVDEESLTLYNVYGNFDLEIVTKIYPHKNTELEGLYKSNGMFCTQNEPEGFRRITYFLDRPDVMAKYTVKVIADKRYPMLLSNGNKKESGEIDAHRHFCVWEDPFAKPSYLFALVAGNLGFVSDSFKTMTGREIELNIYCDLGNESKCFHAMESLKKAMKWDEEKYGREYDLDIYNIVAVDSFNMGAMENKGLNIFNSHYVLADKESATDQNYMGIESVIAHEYFHNWTGNRITCRDWFQLTLKEGLTVYRDQTFSADMNSKEVVRIDNVKSLRERQFVEDAGPTAHPVQPDSYISMNNFYTSTVYEKGAEIIGMYHTLLGEENYKKSMNLYFDTFDGQAVRVDDFFWAMEQNYEGDLSQFKRWYHQSGTPTLQVSESYAEGTLKLTCKQIVPATVEGKDQLPFMYPFKIALFCENGEFIKEETLTIKEETELFTFEFLPCKPKLSLNRGFCAPIKTVYEDQDYPFLMKYDNDSFNRYEAAQEFALRTLNKLIDTGTIDELYVQSYRELLDADTDLMYKAQLLELPSISNLMQTRETIDFVKLCDARESLIRHIASIYKKEFFTLYKLNHDGENESVSSDAMAARALKNRALQFLCSLKSEDIQEICTKQYYDSKTMNDKVTALSLLENYFSKTAESALKDFYDKYKNDMLVMNKYFTVISSAKREDVLSRVVESQRDEVYDEKVPNLVRSLIYTFTRNYRYFHADDGSGYEFIADKVIAIDRINAQIASGLAGAFKIYGKLDSCHKNVMKVQLERILATDNLSDNTYEIVSKILDKK